MEHFNFNKYIMNTTSFSPTNYTNDQDYFSNSNYHSYSNYGNIGTNMNSSIIYNQVLTMTIIPLITTIFTTLFTSLMADIKKSFIYFLNYYNLKYDKKKLIQYKLYHGDKINDEILPIIWFINKTKSIKEGNVLTFEEIIDDKNKIYMLLCPLHKKSYNNNDTQNNYETNNYDNYVNYSYINSSSNINNSTNKYEDYYFVKINDGKNLYYYGCNSNNFCLMSYDSSIQELGEYILEIKKQYLECKSEMDKNSLKEKKIYIELYQDPKNNDNYGSSSIKLINKNVISLIWYLNKKKIITEGILTKLNDSSNSDNVLNNVSNNFLNPIIANNDVINNPLSNNSSLTISKKNNDDIIIMPFISENNSNEIKSEDKNDDKNKISSKKLNSNTNNNDGKYHEVDKYIFCSFVFKKIKSDYYPHASVNKEFIVVSSEKYSINELVNWLESINDEYTQYTEGINKIQYLYTYVSGELSNKFVKSFLDKTQTFEHLFFSKKEEILNDIKNFSNVDYYQKFGMKRKLGYLLVGPPGSGKSALVTAISNLLKRSLKNIPISLIKTNSEFEKAYGDFSYDNQILKSDEIVITFDEIDSAYDTQKLTKNINNSCNKSQDQETKTETKTESKTETHSNTPIIIINNDKDSNSTQSKISNINKDDNLNIGIVLSKLDGNENQEGSVIIATCNDISKLDPALYRNGRLKLIELNYAGREEISQMIEKYCEIVLDNEEKNKIRNDCKIQTLNIKHTIAKYLLDKNFSVCSDNIDEVIELINNL